MKRKSSLLLIAALLVSLLSVSAWATGTAEPNVVNRPEFEITVSHVNPEYAALGVKFTKPAADCMTSAETTVETMEEAADFLREEMENRITEVVIHVNNYPAYNDESEYDEWAAELSANWKVILYDAFEHTGVPTQGDYIMRHYGKSEGSIGHNMVSTATFRYTITYDTTLQQENEVGERIDELFDEWDEESGFFEMTDYEKVCTIYDYICANVTYDYVNLDDEDYTLKFSAYAALINGTAVCQGYGNLFYRMALEADVDTRFIAGMGGGGYHGWNIVELNEKYYYLDSTWDAGRTTYAWFLLGSDNFHEDHTPDPEFRSAEFLAEYPIDTEDYDPANNITLAAPTLTVTNNTTNGKIVLNWTAVENAEKYEVWRSTTKDGEYTKLTTTSGTKITNSTINAGETYYYKVRAVSGNKAGKFSAAIGRTCDCAQPVLTIELNSSGKPVLTWKAVSGATKYEVWRSTSANGTYTRLTTTTGTKITNSSAESGTTYYYKIRAICGANSAGNSAYSEIVSATCISLSAPSLTVTNSTSTGKIVLNWTVVDGAEKYEVWRSTTKDGEYIKVLTTSGRKMTHSSANAGETYYYKVRAIAGDNKGAYSAAIGRTCDLAQPAATVTNNISTGKIVLTWKAVKGADRYEIWRSNYKNGTYIKVLTTTGLKMTHSSAKAGETYYYKVKAICDANASGNSAFSAAVGRTCDLARPSVTITLNSKDKPVISWKAVTGAAKYEVWRATEENGTYTKIYTTASGLKVTNSSAETGVTYYYKVRAICDISAGNSAFSEVQSVTALNAEGVALLAEAESAGLLQYLAVTDPGKYITRLEMTKLLAAAMDLTVTPTSESAFTDCTGLTDEEKGIIAAAVEAGLVTGMGDGTFDPEGKLTRAQLAVLIYRAIGEPETEIVKTFTDVAEDSWYYTAVTALYNLGIVTSEDGTFAPFEYAVMSDALTWLIETLAWLEN